MRRLAALISVCSLVVVAGCGGNDSAAPPDPTADLTPAEILDRAHDATAKVTSFQVNITASVQGTPRAGGRPSALEALIEKPVEVAVTGRVQRPHAMAMDADLQSQTLPLALTLIQKNDGLYLDVVGQTFRLVTPKGSVERIEPANMPLVLVEWTAGVTDAGRETVNNIPVAHLRGTLTKQSLADLGGLVAVLGGGTAPTGAPTADLDTSAIDLWVGTSDLLLHRAQFSVAASGDLQGLANVSALNLETTLEFTDYGEPVDVPTPKDARELRLDDLAGLLGG
jgi:hypothetical protein